MIMKVLVEPKMKLVSALCVGVEPNDSGFILYNEYDVVLYRYYFRSGHTMSFLGYFIR
jgi:hypothetical protein